MGGSRAVPGRSPEAGGPASGAGTEASAAAMLGRESSSGRTRCSVPPRFPRPLLSSDSCPSKEPLHLIPSPLCGTHPEPVPGGAGVPSESGPWPECGVSQSLCANSSLSWSRCLLGLHTVHGVRKKKAHTLPVCLFSHASFKLKKNEIKQNSCYFLCPKPNQNKASKQANNKKNKTPNKK